MNMYAHCRDCDSTGTLAATAQPKVLVRGCGVNQQCINCGSYDVDVLSAEGVRLERLIGQGLVQS